MERVSSQPRRRRPDDEREHHEAADPEARGDEVHVVGELGLPRRPDVDGRVPRQREPGAEHEPEEERGPEQDRPVGEPGQEEERGDEREAERHRDERGPEPRAARERRQVAVDQLVERKLERVGSPENEPEDAELDAADHPGPDDPVEAPLERRVRSPAQHEQPEREPAHEQRQPQEVAPLGDVLELRRASGSVRLGRRRRLDADPERVDARDHVTLVRRDVPAHRVGALGQLAQRNDHLAAAIRRVRRAGRHDLAGRGPDVDRVRERVDRLVELERHRSRSSGESGAVGRHALEQDGVSERRGRQRERDEDRRR